jgi:hypothetical protein
LAASRNPFLFARILPSAARAATVPNFTPRPTEVFFVSEIRLENIRKNRFLINTSTYLDMTI